jgi:amidase
VAELHDLTMLDQAAALRHRTVSATELVEHYLRRIEASGDTVGAFVTVTADAALRAAADADAAASAAGDGDRDGTSLRGVPTAIKDLNLTAGVPTTFGSACRPPVDLGVDDAVVARLAAAGLISLGKTNTPEFGLPCYTEPDVAPPARTPWDLSRSAGGSSGGAGAAVAAGLVPAAQGSDGGGSIRIPSSACGLVGLKPSRGRVSSAPFGVEVTGLSTAGPLARTVRDAAALLDVMAGPVPGDFTWAPDPPYPSFLAACDDEPRALRIGRYRAPVIADATVAPECLAAWEATSDALAALGHEVVDQAPTFTAELVPAFEAVWSAEAARLPITEAEAARCRPLTRWLRDRGLALSGPQLYAALASLRLAARVEIAATGHFDAVLTPTLAQPPAAVGGLRDDGDPAADFEAQKRFTPFTSPYNMTGQPAISLPLHWTDAGLPIGVQLVGRPHDEATLLRLGAQLEAALPWGHRRPPVW